MTPTDGMLEKLSEWLNEPYPSYKSKQFLFRYTVKWTNHIAFLHFLAGQQDKSRHFAKLEEDGFDRGVIHSVKEDLLSLIAVDIKPNEPCNALFEWSGEQLIIFYRFLEEYISVAVFKDASDIDEEWHIYLDPYYISQKIISPKLSTKFRSVFSHYRVKDDGWQTKFTQDSTGAVFQYPAGPADGIDAETQSSNSFRGLYTWLGAAILIFGVAALIIASDMTLMAWLNVHGKILILVYVLQLLCIVAVLRIAKRPWLEPTALAFFIYVILDGLSESAMFREYPATLIVSTFVTCAAALTLASYFGAKTKRFLGWLSKPILLPLLILLISVGSVWFDNMIVRGIAYGCAIILCLGFSAHEGQDIIAYETDIADVDNFITDTVRLSTYLAYLVYSSFGFIGVRL